MCDRLRGPAVAGAPRHGPGDAAADVLDRLAEDHRVQADADVASQPVAGEGPGPLTVAAADVENRPRGGTAEADQLGQPSRAAFQQAGSSWTSGAPTAPLIRRTALDPSVRYRMTRSRNRTVAGNEAIT